MKSPRKYDEEIGIKGYLIALVIIGGFLYFFSKNEVSVGRPKRWVQSLFYMMRQNEVTFWLAKTLLFILCIYFIYKIIQLFDSKRKNQ